MPNASINMAIASYSGDRKYDRYEVLQSQSLGKQLVLSKMNRKV